MLKYKIHEDKLSWFLLLIGYIMLGYLYNIIEFKPISIDFIIKGIGGAIGIYLLYLRFKTTDDMKKIQEEQFHLTNQYSHFLETSKLLTDKDATIEAKISAMYLLYDYAKNHPQEVEKIYQLLSEYIKPLLNCINNNCNRKKYIKVQDTLETEKSSKKRSFKFEKQKKLNLQFNNQETKVIEKIHSWRNKGTDIERMISIALIILRDLTVNILPQVNHHIDLSSIIIFTLKINFIRDERKNLIKFQSKEIPTYNLIFLGCNLENVDFSKSKFYNCKFINCTLNGANFTDSDLTDSEFILSSFKNAKFKGCINAPSI